ncbi:MAG: hypothetical protein IJ325_00835 [Clostridia bacterium]|nr:hypothetical protein [Clostridia bacterium]
MNILQRYIGLLAGISFFTAFGGVLLWVNGSAAPVVFRVTNIPTILPGITICFLLWLLIYGLAGLKIGYSLISTVINKCGLLQTVTKEILAYILLLAWYPLFFSVVHAFFAAVVLCTAIGIQLWSFLTGRRGYFICLPITILQIVLEIYFVLITVTYILIN